jgi:RHS repeat-associated protein
LKSIQATAGSATIQSLSYGFDDKGNLQSRRDELLAFSETFEYDELNRLERWKTTAAAGQATLRFDYDDLGNFKARVWELGNGPGTNYGYDQTNGAGPYAVTSANSYSYGYDGEGNQTSRPGSTNSFNVAGLPTKLLARSIYGTTFAFAYDGFGSRVKKSSTSRTLSGGLRTKTRVSVGGLYYRDSTSGAPATHTYNIVGPDGVLAQVVAGADGTPQPPVYILHDHLGTADTIVDASGAVIERRKFDPWGNLIDPTDPTSGAPTLVSNVPFGFAGHEHDWDALLINMSARMYDPALGRFLSPDPAGPSSLTAAALNRYAYVLNNPSTLRDPFGFDADCPGCGGVGDPLPSPQPFPGGPTGGTTPSPTLPHPQPPARGGVGPRPWNAVDAFNQNLQRSNALSHFGSAAKYDATPRHKGVGQPGLWESLIPIWGSGRAAIDDFQNGHWGWGILHTALAISDVFLVRSLATGVAKISWRGVTWLLTKEVSGDVAVKEVATESVRFTQYSVSPFFKDGKMLSQTIDALKSGALKLNDIPLIRVVEHEGALWALDNRRLVAFAQAGIKNIPVEVVEMSDVALEFAKKFDPIGGLGQYVVVAASKDSRSAWLLLKEFGLVK